MAEGVDIAVLVEKKASLRKEITRQISAIGIQKIIGCAAPQSARRSILTTNQAGLLVIGNSDNLESCYSLIGFCRSRMPNWTIIVLDHINSDVSVIDAFSVGADDLIHVPFYKNEFTARLNIRLAQTSSAKEKNASVNDTAFAKAQLTHTELEIMNFLVLHIGRTVTRNELAQHIDDKDWVYGDRKYDVHITNIRRKLTKGPDARYSVKSVRSVGYYVQEMDSEYPP